jgi:type I restriction enzyme M protein
LDELEQQKEELSTRMQELEEEQSEEEDVFAEVRSDKGKITKALITARIKAIKHDPDAIAEHIALQVYLELLEAEAELKSKIKTSAKALDTKVEAKYKQLSEPELKTLIVDDKWLARITDEVFTAIDSISHRLTSRIKELAERYAQPLPQIESEVHELSQKVEEHLKKMGFTWK